MSRNPIFMGDDTHSFGQTFLEIDAEFPDETCAGRVTVAHVRIGNLPVMVFENPVFPITVNLTSAQTAMLKNKNECYMAVFDEEGLKQTCEGQLTFCAHERVV
jgi:hypothetical protein